MCRTCWESYGSPSVRNEGTEAMAKRLEPLEYELSLHSQVDDWNLEDSSIDYALANPVGRMTDEARAVLVDLKAMPLEERASAMAILEGYI